MDKGEKRLVIILDRILSNIFDNVWATWHHHFKAFALFPPVKIASTLASWRIRNRDAILKRQTRRLRSLLGHAARHVPYYRMAFELIGLNPKQIRAAADLDFLPFVTKDNIKDMSRMLIADNKLPHLCEVWSSSGTTGKPIDAVKPLESQFSMFTRLQTRLFQLGLRDSDFKPFAGNYVYVSDTEYRPQYQRYSARMPIWRLSRLEKFDIRPEFYSSPTDVIRKIHIQKPVILTGKPSSLGRLVDLIEKYDSDNRFPIKPKAILTGAEHLLPGVRKRLRQAFQCRVFDTYGLTEIGLVACECQTLNGMHYEDDEVIIEIIQAGRRVEPGESGEIVITDLTNRAMPLIRYRTGDIGRVTYEECQCGLAYPRLMLIEGRIFDMFITPSGKYFNPLVLLGNLQKMRLRQYQLVQLSAREIKIRYVGGAEPAEVANAIIPEVRGKMGPDISVTAESLTTLDVPGRKTRVFVSEMKASEPMSLDGLLPKRKSL